MAEKIAKGLPDRTRSEAHKKRRAACWLRGEKRKEERRKAQMLRERANYDARTLGLQTPWGRAQFLRAERRANDPQVQERAARWERARRELGAEAA